MPCISYYNYVIIIQKGRIIMTDILHIQTSKALYCDFLLTRLWQKWLKDNHHNPDNDFDLLANLDYVKQCQLPQTEVRGLSIVFYL